MGRGNAAMGRDVFQRSGYVTVPPTVLTSLMNRTVVSLVGIIGKLSKYMFNESIHQYCSTPFLRFALQDT